MIAQALAIARKDLTIEARARVSLNQVVPFAVAVIFLFAFSLDTQNAVLRQIAPGIFWVVITFASLFLVSRSMRIERDNGAIEGLLLAGVNPMALFLGKLVALTVTMLVLEAVVAASIYLLFSANLGSLALLASSLVVATIGMASVGLVYGALASSESAGDSLLPLLVIPVLSPIVVAAAKCWSDASLGTAGVFDPWLKLLVIFSAVFTAVGAVGFAAVLED